MYCRLEVVAGPLCEHVTEVHYISTLDGWNEHPLHVLRTENLESANVVLLQDGDQAIIRVLPTSDLVRSILLAWPVVQQAMCCNWVCHVAVEEVLVPSESKCH